MFSMEKKNGAKRRRDKTSNETDEEYFNRHNE
jgi:hypothetical protein